MTLEEKILKINEPSIAEIPNVGTLPSGTADTIENFFTSFVKGRFPQSDVIKHWHKLLMDYTSDLSRLSCCVRFGNVGTKKPSARGEEGYYKLRRGWLTKNDGDDFEYFFADNFFSSFIYKLALDGVKPSVTELGDLFRQHKFPYGFGFFIDKKINEHNGVVVAIAKDPGFLGSYKLSHVFDSGEYFDIDGKRYGDASLTETYYPIGHSDDFLSNSDRIRRMNISDDAKKVIVAKFLRFAHPFNYFLTPSKNRHVCREKVYKKDIGEDPRMISYVRQYLEKEYPAEYREFVSKIMWYEDPKCIVATGKERIDITYGPDVIATKKSASHSKSGTSGTTPSIIYNPADEEACKQELLKKKRATLIWKYSDGHEETKVWEAKNFSAESGLRNNIQSKPEWRKRAETGLIEVTVIV